MEQIQYIGRKDGQSKTNIWEIDNKRVELTCIYEKHKEILQTMVANTKQRLVSTKSLVLKSELTHGYNMSNVLQIAKKVFYDLLKNYIYNIINQSIAKNKYYMLSDIARYIIGDSRTLQSDRFKPLNSIKDIIYEVINDVTIKNGSLENVTMEELEIKYKVKFIKSTSPTNNIWEITGKRVELYLFNQYLKKGLIVLCHLIDIRLKNKEPLIDERNCRHYLLGREVVKNIMSISACIFSESLLEYLSYCAKEITKTRRVINKVVIEKLIFPVETKHTSTIIDKDKSPNFEGLVYQVVQEEFKKQLELFPTLNESEGIQGDLWILFQRTDGIGLKETTIDFGKVKKPSLRQELKSYIREEFKSCDNYKKLYDRFIWVTKGLNYFSDHYKYITWCSDIDKKMIYNLKEHLKREECTEFSTKKKLAVASQAKVFQNLKCFFDFLINFEGLKTPRPHFNYFSGISYHNISSTYKNTEIISEKVVNGLLEHIDDLEEQYQRILLISLNTGMRAKEVIYLEENCYSYDKDEEVWKLEFIPWKVLESRRKADLEDYTFVVIKEHIVKEIQDQIKSTKELRKRVKSNKIFLYEVSRVAETIKLPQTDQFNKSINQLIKKHNITDESGELVYFHHKQCRKLLAVTMIENGAKPREVSVQLGHMQEETTNKYYNEVRKIKLADLNSDFYKKKFKLLVTSEQLENYTEEERKLLYVGFCTDHRDVELGKCIKPFSKGICKREGDEKVSCATCPNLCVSMNSLNKWEKLYHSKKEIVSKLKKCYENEGIDELEYTTFREYQKELYLLNAYKDVIDKIENANSMKCERKN